VGNDDKAVSLGKKETGALAALPVWLEFMQTATEGTPVQDFENVTPLDKQSASHVVTVDTPDLAPTEPSEQGLPSISSPDDPSKTIPPVKPAPPVIKHTPPSGKSLPNGHR
jgi:penicillin-binding protein 1A